MQHKFQLRSLTVPTYNNCADERYLITFGSVLTDCHLLQETLHVCSLSFDERLANTSLWDLLSLGFSHQGFYTERDERGNSSEPCGATAGNVGGKSGDEKWLLRGLCIFFHLYWGPSNKKKNNTPGLVCTSNSTHF